MPTYLELLIFSPALFVYSQGVSALEKKIHDCYYTEGADRDEMEGGINPLKG